MTRPNWPRLAATIGALTALVVTLHWAGRFDIRGPTGLSREELSTWTADPVIVVATAARWLALFAGWYLLVVTIAVGLLGVPAEPTGWRRLVPTRVVGFTASMLGIIAVAAPLATNLDRTVTVEPEPPTTLTMDNVTPLRLEPIDDAPAPLATDPAGASGSSHTRPPAPDVPPPAAERAGAETAEVRPGESFWSLAEDHLQDSWGRRQLTDAEIVPYWRELIEANRGELVDPDNPDLLLPGQRLTFPEAPPDPA